MIPRAQVDVSWDVDYASLRVPSEAEIEEGLFGIRQYSAQFVLEADWEEAVACLASERAAVDRVASEAPDEGAFDKLAQEEEADVIVDDVLGDFVTAPDLGVQAACLALCAAGCVTGASCRGHPGEYAWSSWPVILFAGDPRRVSIVEQVARQAGCGLAGSGDRLELWAPSLAQMLRFAELMIERRTQFDEILLSAAIRRAREQWPEGECCPPESLPCQLF